MASYNMETNQQIASEAATNSNKEYSNDAHANNMDTTVNSSSGYGEPIQTWKQLAQTEKALEKALNHVVEAAIELQCDFATLITKTATLFDPNIIEIISSCGNGTIGKSADNRMDEKELDNNWEEKLADFDKLKQNESQPSSHVE